MICEAPLRKGPNKGKPATGTHAGYRRHRVAGEVPCESCWEAIGGTSKPRLTALPSGQRVQVRHWDSHGQLRPVPVVCRGCGARGRANPAVTGGRRTVDSCSECREVA